MTDRPPAASTLRLMQTSVTPVAVEPCWLPGQPGTGVAVAAAEGQSVPGRAPRFNSQRENHIWAYWRVAGK